MNRTDAIWAIGRPTIGNAVKLASRFHVYGAERVPLEGGLVVASNHFSWLDPPALGEACPRTLYFMAKVEAHRVPGLGQLMRSFGAFSLIATIAAPGCTGPGIPERWRVPSTKSPSA